MKAGEGIMRKGIKIALIVITIALLMLGIAINLISIGLNNNNQITTSWLIFSMTCSLVYLILWLMFLTSGLKRNSKILLNIYYLFWLSSTVSLFFYLLFVWFRPILSLPFLPLGYLSFATLVGFDLVIPYLLNLPFQLQNVYVAFSVSLIMLLLGYFAKQKYKTRIKHQ